jgi:hypothetical protein
MAHRLKSASMLGGGGGRGATDRSAAVQSLQRLICLAFHAFLE